MYIHIFLFLFCWMTRSVFWNYYVFSSAWQWEQIPPNRQAQIQCKKTGRELAKNFGTLVRTNVHLETVQIILQFPKQHQPQQTSRYKNRWRRCARRMTLTNIYVYIYIYILYLHYILYT